MIIENKFIVFKSLCFKSFIGFFQSGVFFQWILCVGIWIVGLVVNAIRNFPPFHPLVMIGGFVWCTGELFLLTVCINVY